MPEASPQGSARDRVCRLRLERLTHCQSFLGPLWWAILTNVQGAVFYPLLGTPGILIPNMEVLDKSAEPPHNRAHNLKQRNILNET
jgi:hypothetical protein